MYNSAVCHKHKGHKHEVESAPHPTDDDMRASMPPSEDLWWTEEIETDTTLCAEEDNVCEFDAYDGVCWHCKKVVEPDTHLLHLVLADLVGSLLQPRYVGSDGISYLMLRDHPEIPDAAIQRLVRILEKLEERDIDLVNADEGTPESRAEALQKTDDREHILSEMQGHLDDDLHEELESALNMHIQRVQDWDIDRVNWSPEDWGLTKPDKRSTRPQQEAFWDIGTIGLPVALAAYAWFCLDWLSDFEGGAPTAELACYLMPIGLLFIIRIFSGKDASK